MKTSSFAYDCFQNIRIIIIIIIISRSVLVVFQCYGHDFRTGRVLTVHGRWLGPEIQNGRCREHGSSSVLKSMQVIER